MPSRPRVTAQKCALQRVSFIHIVILIAANNSDGIALRSFGACLRPVRSHPVSFTDQRNSRDTAPTRERSKSNATDGSESCECVSDAPGITVCAGRTTMYRNAHRRRLTLRTPAADLIGGALQLAASDSRLGRRGAMRRQRHYRHIRRGDSLRAGQSLDTPGLPVVATSRCRTSSSSRYRIGMWNTSIRSGL
jgi:hypothetical protein